MSHDWDTGVMYGETRAEQRNLGRRLDRVEQDYVGLRAEVSQLRAYLIRGGLLLVLAMAALGTNLGAERLGEFTGTTIKSLIK